MRGMFTARWDVLNKSYSHFGTQFLLIVDIQHQFLDFCSRGPLTGIVNPTPHHCFPESIV